MPSLGFLNAFRFDEERVQFLAYCKESTRKFLAWCEHVLADTSQRADFSYFFDTRAGFSKSEKRNCG